LRTCARAQMRARALPSVRGSTGAEARSAAHHHWAGLDLTPKVNNHDLKPPELSRPAVQHLRGALPHAAQPEPPDGACRGGGAAGRGRRRGADLRGVRRGARRHIHEDPAEPQGSAAAVLGDQGATGLGRVGRGAPRRVFEAASRRGLHRHPPLAVRIRLGTRGRVLEDAVEPETLTLECLERFPGAQRAEFLVLHHLPAREPALDASAVKAMPPPAEELHHVLLVVALADRAHVLLLQA